MAPRRFLHVRTMITGGVIMCASALSMGQVCTGDVFLNKQAEVDAFNCKEVTGRLVVSGENITNLEPLRILERAGGLEIRNTNAASIGSFASLTEIQGRLIIDGNPLLTEIGSFASLTKHTGDIEITSNNSLTTINGFSSLALLSNGSLSITTTPY